MGLVNAGLFLAYVHCRSCACPSGCVDTFELQEDRPKRADLIRKDTQDGTDWKEESSGLSHKPLVRYERDLCTKKL